MKRYKPVGINNDEISFNTQKRGYYRFGEQILSYLTKKQIPSLYFAEYGNIYNTATLNLINDAPELHKK